MNEPNTMAASSPELLAANAAVNSFQDHVYALTEAQKAAGKTKAEGALHMYEHVTRANGKEVKIHATRSNRSGLITDRIASAYGTDFDSAADALVEELGYVPGSFNKEGEWAPKTSASITLLGEGDVLNVAGKTPEVKIALVPKVAIAAGIGAVAASGIVSSPAAMKSRPGFIGRMTSFANEKLNSFRDSKNQEVRTPRGRLSRARLAVIGAAAVGVAMLGVAVLSSGGNETTASAMGLEAKAPEEPTSTTEVLSPTTTLQATPECAVDTAKVNYFADQARPGSNNLGPEGKKTNPQETFADIMERNTIDPSLDATHNTYVDNVLKGTAIDSPDALDAKIKKYASNAATWKEACDKLNNALKDGKATFVTKSGTYHTLYAIAGAHDGRPEIRQSTENMTNKVLLRIEVMGADGKMKELLFKIDCGYQPVQFEEFKGVPKLPEKPKITNSTLHRTSSSVPPSTSPPRTTPPSTSPPRTTPPSTSPPRTTPPSTSPPRTTPPSTSPPRTTPPSTSPPRTTPRTTPKTAVPPVTSGPATTVERPRDTSPPTTHRVAPPTTGTTIRI